MSSQIKETKRRLRRTRYKVEGVDCGTDLALANHVDALVTRSTDSLAACEATSEERLTEIRLLRGRLESADDRNTANIAAHMADIEALDTGFNEALEVVREELVCERDSHGMTAALLDAAQEALTAALSERDAAVSQAGVLREAFGMAGVNLQALQSIAAAQESLIDQTSEVAALSQASMRDRLAGALVPDGDGFRAVGSGAVVHVGGQPLWKITDRQGVEFKTKDTGEAIAVVQGAAA